MTDKPKALELADLLDNLSIYDRGGFETEEAIAELRRLHEVNQTLIDAMVRVINAACKPDYCYMDDAVNYAEKALAKAKEST